MTDPFHRKGAPEVEAQMIKILTEKLALLTERGQLNREEAYSKLESHLSKRLNIFKQHCMRAQ